MESVLDNIEKSIALYNSHISVIHNKNCFTYQDLETQSNRLANYLKSFNVKSGSKVAFLMYRSFDMLITILAIWKLGATYVPLDPKTPKNRISHVLNEINPICVVSEPALLSKISYDAKLVLTLFDLAYIYDQEDYYSINRYDDDLLAYIIYTSGSTGQPKGVMLTHANIANHINWLIQDFQFSHRDCFSFNSSMAFDFSVACTILPLAVGAKIVITSENDTLDIEKYCEHLVKNKVTFVKWTPSYFKLLVDYVEQNRPDLSAFRYLMTGGEELLTSYVERWLSIYPEHSIINEYGPTEASVGITAHLITKDNLDKKLYTVPIGSPAINTNLYIIDDQNNLVKDGEVGELLIGGASVASGYYNQPKLTSDRFIDNPFVNNNQKLYRTGDLVKRLSDNTYLYISRIDNQIKVNGFRVELNEIEHWILNYPGVEHVKVIFDKHNRSNPMIIAYLVINEAESIVFDELRKYLANHLPKFMLPNRLVKVDCIPCNRNGKVDLDALKMQGPSEQHNQNKLMADENDYITFLVYIIKKYVVSNQLDVNTSFFTLGITSLLATQIVNDINAQKNTSLKVHDLFTYPTISALADYIQNKKNDKYTFDNKIYKNLPTTTQPEPIAVIAMDCRLPGAESCEAFWKLCQEGIEAISFFESKSKEDKYVYARGILNDIEYFDANFFNLTPKEAHLSDPQHRLLIESAWNVLEKAGYTTDPVDHYKTGVYVSMNDSTYLLDHDIINKLESNFSDRFAMLRLISPQCLATKIAYLLNCTGPSITVQTACSSSLVAIALACQQLSSYQCNLALAGGVSIVTPQDRPYLYQQGNIFSPDGHCRPFDAQAFGTVFSNGLGTVVLKRLADALEDNDSIICVIKSAITNNDGYHKMSYAAPSAQGQIDCILTAQHAANIHSDSIQYIETHGTGTLVGDPIEIEALTKTFQLQSHKQQTCALGSLKGNIGHTHVAAGVAGLIRAALALQHKQVPPSINFDEPNPNIDWENSPFYVNKRLRYWPRNKEPRRAAVSAFGVGGTNAHVILEEAPEFQFSQSYKKSHLLLLSAKTPDALKIMCNNLVDHLKMVSSVKDQQSTLADIAYTLQVGRKKFDYRAGVVCHDLDSAINRLESNMEENIYSVCDVDYNPKLVFLFPGQGSQYTNLTLSLYLREKSYREQLDNCLDIASLYVGCNLKDILFLSSTNLNPHKLNQTEFAYPILFSVEYALANLLMEWGINPDAMIGHSLGEYVAACLSGVFSLDDAMKLVCAQGKFVAETEQSATENFLEVLKTVCKKKPRIPYLSNLTGNWIKESDVKSDDYWVNHMISSVQFSKCANLLTQKANWVFIEVGPGKSLLSLLQRNTKQLINGVELIPDEKQSKSENHQIEDALITLWYKNCPINWHAYYRNEKRSRIMLPTYPFQRKRYWFDEIVSDSNKIVNDASSFYVPTWLREPEPFTEEMLSFQPNSNYWIIFDDNSSLSKYTIDNLMRNENKVFIVRKGNDYSHISSNKYMINPKIKNHYYQIINDIIEESAERYTILHFWSTKNDSELDEDNWLESTILYDGLYSGIFLVQAFYACRPKANLSCVMITTNLQKVLGNEHIIPLKSGVLSLCRVIPLENKNHHFVAIDIDDHENPQFIPSYSTQIIKQAINLFNEKESHSLSTFAFRNQYCWKVNYEQINQYSDSLYTKLDTKQTGVYLITGGLGAMGLTIADWLSQKSPTTLLLISRSFFPLQDKWDSWLKEKGEYDLISQKIIKLKQIVSRNSTVVTAAIDIANYQQMKDLIETTERIHGKIMGVFHLAGVPGEGLTVLKDKTKMSEVLLPKIQGTQVLSQLFKKVDLDFIIFASSLTAVAGGIGQIDYCAANLFLDYFIQQQPFEKCKRILVLNWNSWSSIGMASNVKDSSRHKTLYAKNSVTPEEGIYLLEKAFKTHYKQIVISQNSPESERRRIVNAFESNKENISDYSLNQIKELSVRDVVKKIWQDILGIDVIQTGDTFYSLGGDSLLAIQLLVAIENRLNVIISLQELAHAHTLDSLVSLIETRPVRTVDIIVPCSKNIDFKDCNKYVYFIHPIGGTILCYLPLISYLNTDILYYAIQDPELISGQSLFFSIQEMAERYAKAICAQHKKEEIILIGASFGGNIAVEMVNILKKTGINVLKVILIDSWASMEYNVEHPQDEESRPIKSLEIIKNYYGIESQQYKSIIKRLCWLRSYIPSCIDTPLVLLAARDLLPIYKKITCESNGWLPYSSLPVLKHIISGSHDTMLQQDYIPDLARLLNTLI